MTEPLRLVVLADSFAFTDHHGPQLPDEPALFPNVTARELERLTGRSVRVATIAAAGWGVRELWRALTKDRHLQFEVLAGADAVVVAVGSYDHLPAGLPVSLAGLVPHVRSAPLRRRLRRWIDEGDRLLIRATGGRFRRVPMPEFERLYDLALRQIRGLTHGAPTVAVGPAGQRSERYGRRNPHLALGEVLQERIADRHGIAFVPSRPLVSPHRDGLNPDGIHWPHEAHREVGRAAGAILADQLTGRRRPPPDPWDRPERIDRANR